MVAGTALMNPNSLLFFVTLMEQIKHELGNLEGLRTDIERT